MTDPLTSLTWTYSLSQQQFMRAARAWWSYRALSDAGNLALSALAVLAGGGLLAYGQPVGWVFLASAVVFVSLTLLRNWLWRRAYHRIEKYQAPITVTFSAEQVQTRSAEGQSDLPWDAFSSYAETPDWFILTMGRRGLSFIPKSAAADPLEVERLRNWMVAKLPRKKMRWT